MNPPLSARPAWWQWLTVLSLDAPAVAVTWQALWARMHEIPLRAHHYTLLAAGVWVVYAADRWLEGFEIHPGAVSTQRHRFYQRNRLAVAVAIALVAAACGALAVLRLTAAEWRMVAWVGSPVAAYLVVGAFLRRHSAGRIPKEACIAALFAQPRSLAAPLGWFAALCFINLALIARWERGVDVAHGQHSMVSAHPRRARWIAALPWLGAIAAGLAAVAGLGGPQVVTACAAGSALLMGTLDRLEPQIGRQRARALVDLALLTPWLAMC